MGLLFFCRGAFTSANRVGKYGGRCLCVTLNVSGASAPSGIQVKRYSSQGTNNGGVAPGQFVCYHLCHRTLLKIQGQDTSPFLQGIITNDMTLLEEPAHKVMYSHMLNVQGRTLYDIMLYSLKEAEAGQGVFLECDCTVKDSILRHLKVYKIRRKITINPCPDLSVWAVLPKHKSTGEEASTPELSSPEKALVWETDPRTQMMGWRLVVDSQDVKSLHTCSLIFTHGVKDLPPGTALPLESNLVFMQGISFSKGCYIGQELTARTHHTGVIRKRLMPARLSAPVSDLEDGASLQTQSGKPAGKYRAGVGELGLSLIRMAHAKEVLTLKSSDDTKVTLEVAVPDWWPKDVKVN
uniref:Iron-sulfur cluster assembly factor IBA57 n=1 Tax=Labrus bergylta TaxID=56723 RepID=A0A3Q3EZN0_9LABR